MKEVRQSLADCMFCLACQTPLSKEDVLQLIGHLRNDRALTAAGTLDDVTIALLLAVLYCIDAQALGEEDSEGEGREEGRCISYGMRQLCYKH